MRHEAGRTAVCQVLDGGYLISDVSQTRAAWALNVDTSINSYDRSVRNYWSIGEPPRRSRKKSEVMLGQSLRSPVKCLPKSGTCTIGRSPLQSAAAARASLNRALPAARDAILYEIGLPARPSQRLIGLTQHYCPTAEDMRRRMLG